MNPRRLAVVGAGGFARVAWPIREINRENPAYEFIGYVVRPIDLSRLSEASGSRILPLIGRHANVSSADDLKRRQELEGKLQTLLEGGALGVPKANGATAHLRDRD